MKRQHESAKSSKEAQPQMAAPAKSRKQVEEDSNELESIEKTIRVKSSCASEVFNELYLNERMADVFFTFEDSTERVPAHKAILSIGSSVFDEMFSDSSTAVNGDGDMMVARYSPEAFKDFLQFFYLNEITLKSTTITDVLHLAWTHNLPSKYLEMCGRFCLDHYDCRKIDVICLIYEFALLFQNKKSQTICEYQIGINCKKIFETHGFLSCSFKVFGHILDLDTLLCNEARVFEACLDWARHKCKQNGKDKNDVENLRKFLIDDSKGVNLLHKIRYNSISYLYLPDYVDVLDKLFPDANEFKDVMHLMSGSKTLKTGKFSTEARKGVWNDERATECMFSKKELCSKLLAKERFNHVLKINQTILLGGFYIVPLVLRPSALTFICVDVSIKEQRNGAKADNVMESKLIHKQCEEVFKRMEMFYVQLKPVFMQRNFEYHIEIDLKLKWSVSPYYDVLNDTNSLRFYDEVKSNQEIQLNGGNLTIQCHSKNLDDHSLIKGIKFIQL